MSKIGIIVGSLRKAAFSKKIAKNLLTMFPEGFDVEIIDINDLDMYNQDFDDENRAPESWTTFRNKVKEMDGIVFVTPEYNRSLSAAIKNAIDVGSRPYGFNVWDGKPALVVSSSPGATGGFGANHALRQTLVFPNMPILQSPEAYLGHIDKLLDEDDNFIPDTKKYVQAIVDSYVSFFTKLTK
ncbi:NAD(P)H-dependent oxidoreductase [Streptococcaceae bacterium ESL0687]|nr:NAD(P)H-dependent oxidoreductase [Streptococcaceae bacterium ESL0687]